MKNVKVIRSLNVQDHQEIQISLELFSAISEYRELSRSLTYIILEMPDLVDIVKDRFKERRDHCWAIFKKWGFGKYELEYNYELV